LTNHKQELPVAAMDILYRLRGFRGEDLLETDQLSKELSMVAMFVNGEEQNEQSL